MASDDEYSDPTDNDEYQDSSSKKGKNKKVKGNPEHFLLRGKLNRPRHCDYSSEALYKQMKYEGIDLEPDYQRDVVWSEAKQISLIDSILRCYNIPPIIFAVTSSDTGMEKRTCIDGKQRLTSIRKFVDGLIPHKDPYSGESYFYIDNPSHPVRAKKILPEAVRRQFDTRTLLCTEYQDITDAQEREIFERVQKGVALTPAEKLAVIKSPRTALVKRLLEKFVQGDDAGLSSEALDWDNSRGWGFRCIAETLRCIVVKPKTTSFYAAEKWLKDQSPVSAAFVSGVEETYGIFVALVRDPRTKEHFTKVGPIVFLMIGVLVDRLKSKLSLEALGKAVGEMQEDVRKVHQEIRNNSKVSKTMLAFVDGYRAAPALRPGEKSAVEEVRGGGLGVTVQGAAGVKRKAGDVDAGNGSDEEDAAVGQQEAATPNRKRTRSKKMTAAAAPPDSSASTSALTADSVSSASVQASPKRSRQRARVPQVLTNASTPLDSIKPAASGVPLASTVPPVSIAPAVSTTPPVLIAPPAPTAPPVSTAPPALNAPLASAGPPAWTKPPATSTAPLAWTVPPAGQPPPHASNTIPAPSERQAAARRESPATATAPVVASAWTRPQHANNPLNYHRELERQRQLQQQQQQSQRLDVEQPSRGDGSNTIAVDTGAAKRGGGGGGVWSWTSAPASMGASHVKSER